LNLPLYIARKYFFSRNISNVIHIISLISILGIFFGSAALIIILSAFNGFETVVGKLYASFDSDLKISPVSGKYFIPDSVKMQKLAALANIKAITPVIEENALFRYRSNQCIGTIKAIKPDYIHSTGVDSMTVTGSDVLYEDSINYAVIGGGISYKLNMHGYDEIHPIQVYVPRKGVEISTLNPENSLSEKDIVGGGIFSIQQDFDQKYVLMPIGFARDLLNEPKAVTSIEINLKDKEKANEIQSKVIAIMGHDFIVLDRFQQHPSLYKVMHVEKAAVYLVMSLILLIATFNLIGSLLMLALEKEKDMAILLGMGARQNTIKRIITFEGLLLSVSGGSLGIAIGGIICWLQLRYGFVTLGGADSTFVVTAYPVAFNPWDFLVVFITVLVLGFLASWYPARMANKKIGVGVLSSRE